MKIKFSGLGVVDGRGKLNGTVFSRNRGGAIARVKVTPVNPNTAAQAAARSILTALSQAWRGLGQAVIDAWNSAVGDFQRTDIFGDLRTPTGKNLYTRLNANLISVGIAQITSPPALLSVPAPAITGVTLSVGTPTYEIAFSGTLTGVRCQVWATPGLSPGISFVKSEYRQIGATTTAPSSPYDFEADYLAKFGAPPVGSKVFVQLVPINVTSGQSGIGSSASVIAAA